MNKTYISINNKLLSDTKGITPKYEETSSTIILNQKCVRNGCLDYSFAQYVSDEQKFDDKKYVKVGDVLINSTGTGTAGRAALVDYIPNGYKVTVDSHMLILRFPTMELSRFFAYSLFRQERFILDLLTGSSGQGELDREIVYNISFPFAGKNLFIFNKILNSINKKIELNNKINDKLEKIAKMFYNYWFIQFDFPDKNDNPYKSSGGKMIFNKALKRYIPEGWTNGCLNDFINAYKTGDWGQEEYKEPNFINKVNCIRGKDFASLNNGADTDTPIRYISKNNADRFLEPYDLVVEISGGSPTQSTGRITYINEETLNRFDKNIICSNFCKAFSLKKNDYLYYFLQQWKFLYDSNILFNYEGKTSGIKNLLFEAFTGSYDVVIPCDKVISAYYEKVYKMYTLIQQNYAENQELANLRDWLLPILMNGQVGLKESSPETTGSTALSSEKLINEAINQYKNNGSVDIESIARANDMVVYKDSSVKKAEITFNQEKELWQIAVREPQDNFSIAHEIAHAVLHPEFVKQAAVARKDEHSLPKEKEVEADCLAAEILMPEECVLEYLKDENIADNSYLDKKFVEKSAKKFNVAPSSMNMRLENLGYKVPYLGMR